jgi:hypothetical protein
VELTSGNSDKLLWHWEYLDLYSCSLAYAALFNGQIAIQGAPQLWKTQPPNKCHFFVWLMFLERCWTTERLHRHSLSSTDECALCSQDSEQIDHLLLQCAYSREVWYKVLQHCGWKTLSSAPHDHFTEWWLRSRKRVAKPHRRAFDSLTICVVWSLWLQRNE